MVEKRVISALAERRARVTGDLQNTHLRIMRLKGEPTSIDNCIRMFNADYGVEASSRRWRTIRTPRASPGMGSRKTLDILRQSGEALSSSELARRVFVMMDKDTSEKAILILAKTIQSSFSRQRHPVVTFDRSSWPGKWRLLPP